MRAVLQRVLRAKVTVGHKVTGSIGRGLLVFVGVAVNDSENEADRLAEKIVNLRLFADTDGKMNLSLLDIKGELLVVSQFMLMADASRGRRPSYIQAAPPEKANSLYEYFVSSCRRFCNRVETGEFQAMMDVELVNDGPVTINLDTSTL